MKLLAIVPVISLFVLTFFLWAPLTGCSDKCKGVSCQHGGYCSNKKCVCPAGYIGSSCESALNDVVVGMYKCHGNNCVFPYGFDSTIWVSYVVKDTTNTTTGVMITYYDNFGKTVKGTVDSAGRIIIGNAQLDSNHSVLAALGIYSGDTLKIYDTISYRFPSGASTRGACLVTMVRQ